MPTGTRIKELRKQKGLTQKQLGELCGMYESQIRKYENGNANPKIETLQKIAFVLGVPITELINWHYDIVDGEKVQVFDLTDMSLPQVVEAVERIRDSCSNKPESITMHFSEEDYTEEELNKIREFAEFLKSKRTTEKP